MPSLSTLIQGKRTGLLNITESNLERGFITVFQPGAEYNGYRCGWCWKPCGTGCAIIEVWGAAGSGGKMCCCGLGLPGNPGAYARRTICVTASQYICSTGTGTCEWGMSCGNADALCFRGCSNPTGVCWFSTTTNGCICAEGGRGGDARCVASAGFSIFCCFVALGYPATNLGSAGCGLVCHKRTGDWEPQAYGGDVNCPGGFSCLYVGACDPFAMCCHKHYVRTSAGKFAVDGATAEVVMQCAGCLSVYSGGQTVGPFYAALAALSHSPTAAAPYMSPWNGSSPCGCYEAWGCLHRLSTGIPGLSAVPCPDVRDQGWRGGHGAARITFFCTL